jgi:hypothetical protein
MVVADELEVTALREDCGFIVDRAVLETEEQAGGDPIAPDHLEEVTHRNHATFFRAKRKKSMDGPLQVTDRNGFPWRGRLQATDE